MLRSFIAFALIGMVTMSAGGCGGSSDSQTKGVSFEQQAQDALKESSPADRASKLIRIAAGQAKANDKFGARDTMQLAAKACREIEDPKDQAESWIGMAEAQRKLGERSGTRKATEAAGKAIDKIEDAGKKGKLLARLAQVMAGGDDADATAKVLAEAEKLAAEIKSPMGRATALCRIAQGFKKIERPDETRRVIGDLITSSGLIEDALVRCDVLTEIAVLQHGMGESKAADTTFDLATAAAEAIPASDDISAAYGQSYALCQVTQKLLDIGKYAKAKGLLKKAEKLLPSIPNTDLQGQITLTINKLKRELPDG